MLHMVNVCTLYKHATSKSDWLDFWLRVIKFSFYKWNLQSSPARFKLEKIKLHTVLIAVGFSSKSFTTSLLSRN